MPRVPAQIRLEGSTNTRVALAREAWAASHRARHKVLVPVGQPSYRLSDALKSPSPSADPGGMWRKAAYTAVMAVALLASGQAVALGGTAVPRGQAERNVLRFLARGLSHHRLPARLVDPRTHLLRNNTQAICRRARGQRAGDFACVVRPARHRRLEGLHLSYRSLDHGRFRVRWLFYRRG